MLCLHVVHYRVHSRKEFITHVRCITRRAYFRNTTTTIRPSCFSLMATHITYLRGVWDRICLNYRFNHISYIVCYRVRYMLRLL